MIAQSVQYSRHGGWWVGVRSACLNYYYSEGVSGCMVSGYCTVESNGLAPKGREFT